MGRSPTERIDGWKSIAAHLGRDRSTVIRWAKERALPVHALPGGKSRTVYALRHELDAWVRGQETGALEGEPAPDAPAADGDPAAPDRPAPFLPGPLAATVLGGGITIGPAGADRARATDPPRGEPLPDDTARHPPGPVTLGPATLGAVTLPARTPAPPDTDPAPALRRRWRRLAAAGGLVGVTVAVLAATGQLDRTPPALDAATTARLVQARDDLATRSEARLNTARATLTTLAQRHPDSAAIHEALAEAWILAREYGSEPDALAFDRARAAAAAARRLDPTSAVADRVDGVAAYWWDRDPARAGILFRRAIARAPQDALAHLWYANILADNDEDAAAQREFTAARTILPGAPYLLADYAWGLWSAGKEAEAVAQLNALSAYTRLASVADCLSVIALAKGDMAGYARHLRARAAIRRHAELTAYSEAVDRALALKGGQGRQAAYAVMLSRAISLAENTERPDHSWPAFVAHVAGDRAQLLAILRDARARDEHWGAAGFVRRMRVRWAGDAAILRGLDALAQPRIEPPGATTESTA